MTNLPLAQPYSDGIAADFHRFPFSSSLRGTCPFYLVVCFRHLAFPLCHARIPARSDPEKCMCCLRQMHRIPYNASNYKVLYSKSLYFASVFHFVISSLSEMGGFRVLVPLAEHLRPFQFGVRTIFCQQFLTRAHLLDALALDHSDLIGIADRGEPVGDHQTGLSL